MKILIVDDNNDKLAKMLDVLTGVGVVKDDVRVAYTVLDAKRELRDIAFDLLILDVVLPVRAGDKPRHQASVDLLTELSDRATLKKPKHIIGFTAFDDALADAGPAFVSRTWTVVKFSFESLEWQDQLISCVRYIQGAEERIRPKGYNTDVCLVTALASPEFDAVMRIEWEWRSAEPLDDNTFVRRGKFQSGGRTYTATAANVSRMGMVTAALLAAKLIAIERPRFIVMPGICAGIVSRANLGDVVVADPSWDWQSGKHFVEDDAHGFAIAPEPVALASFVRARFEQMRARREVWTTIREGWPEPPDTELKLKIAPMVSGSAVLADSDLVTRITTQHRNLTAIEMEAFGIVSAAANAGHPRPTAFACKSVCDFADETKNDRWRFYAAYTSAQAIRVFFEQYMFEIEEFAGTR